MKRRLAGDERQERRGKRPRKPARDTPHEVRARAAGERRNRDEDGREAAGEEGRAEGGGGQAGAGAPALRESTERARTAEPPAESTTTPPSGTELVTTAIQAAGELAQIGLAVGGQVLRRAVG